MCADRKDRLYAQPLDSVGDFRFDEQVARVFPDMINRSVPGYGTLVALIGQMAGEFLQPDSVCYDLGCSLGAVSYAVAGSRGAQTVEIMAVDNAPAMIERLQENLRTRPARRPVHPQCADVRDLTISRTSLVVLNLTLQFLPARERLGLLQKIYAGLLPGGALILSEKLSFADADEQARMEGLHQAFKLAQGYSELEISQKRTALERVMVPDTLEQHRARLAQAGFRTSDVWFRCLNFCSLVCRK